MRYSSDQYDDLFDSDPSTVAVAIPMTQIGPKLWLFEQPDGRGIVCRADNAHQARTFPADIRYADAEDVAAGAQQRWFTTLCSRHGRQPNEEVNLGNHWDNSRWIVSRALSTCGGGHWRLLVRRGVSVRTLPVTACNRWLMGECGVDEGEVPSVHRVLSIYGITADQLQAAA